ncbi:MAG: ABC transporter ATP-binding protein [Candidatus Bathyarchaeia archaeon]|jgi:ABC-2 type transport system ATP-binding protein
MALIVAEDLAKSYGRVRAVDGLSVRLDEGSVTGLIGPNGAGKTTTIKMILGLLKPDKGSVRVFDEDPWDNSKIRSMVGVVHEKAFFPSHYKTLDYLEKACRIFGVPESRAAEVLRLVDLQDASDREIRALSAGMLQKFAIAHALVHSPRLMVADEMTANLDPQARSSLLDLILRLYKDEKMTFLLSSHILPELSRVCDSVAIINEGKVLASGKLLELYDKYAAGMIRISTDKPDELSVEVGRLPYVERVDSDVRGISVRIQRESEDKLYEDAPRLAKKVGARIQGIETGSASLEELYRLVVGGNKRG